ncbi:MAG: YfjI family protein [Chloroflexota bacterium]|nr:YfjI family protein [Chloroflexota bacterium]
MSAASAGGAAPLILPDPALIRESWEALVEPGTVHEVRIPKTRKGPSRLWGVASGYFSDPDALVAALSNLTGLDAEGVYLTLNPVDPALLARAANRLAVGRPPTTADVDVLRVRHLLIDLDPVRPTGISATEVERDAALAARDAVRHYLRYEAAWPHPVAVVESGNGGGLLYRLDLPNNPDTVDLVRRTLTAIAVLFSTDRVTVDTGTFNPARLTKLVGTVASKGDDIPDRPWRVATGRFTPHPVVVPRERLSAVTALAPVPARSLHPVPSEPAGGRQAEVRQHLDDRGITFTEKSKPWATVFALDRCLTSPDHADGAAVFAFPSGALAYRCLHDRCVDKGWADVREDLGFGGTEAGPVLTVNGSLASGAAPIQLASTPAHSDAWPVLDPAALYGLPGAVVRALDPHTEGDPAATLVNYLVMFGSAVGLTPHARVGERRHHANEFAVLVGATSKGRKGTSHDAPQAIVSAADPDWASRVMGGLASGEGLIWAIRDPIEGIKKGEVVEVDPGVLDKRLLAVEEEFSAVCRVATRDGNTLSETIRRAWDGKPLGNLTKNSPARCGAPHIAVLAHVTQAELRRVIDSTDAANGFGNRFLWVCVQRSKLLPEGGRLPDEMRESLVAQTRTALQTARRLGEVRRDEEATALWAELYPDLSAPGTGLFGAMTDRAEAHVLRLSLLYALADGARRIGLEHLAAALALWDYCAASARHVFGDALGDPIADRILAALRGGGPLDRTQINELFGRHAKGPQLDRGLGALLAAGRARTWVEATGGRPRTLWAAG